MLGRIGYEKAKEGELSRLSLRREVAKLRSKVSDLEATCTKQQDELESF